MQAPVMAQARNISFREPYRQVGGLVVVPAAEDLSVSVYPRQCLAIGQRDVQPKKPGLVFEPAVDRFEQGIAPLTCHG